MFAWCVKCKTGIGCVGEEATTILVKDFDDYHRLCKRQGVTFMKLTREQKNKFLHNALVFLAPVGVIYFGAVAYTLQLEGHVFSFRDFVPSSFTVGAMVLYIVNTLLDLSRKLKESN